MKVLHIATSVGSQSASYRIHKALRSIGVDSLVYVNTTAASIKDDFVISSSGKIKKAINLSKLMLELFFINFTHNISPYSFGIISSMDKELIIKTKPDIINLHWICGTFISISDMEFLSKYKIVWTLHDSWAFTGGCHIPFECKKYILGCENCEQIKNDGVFDVTRYIFEKKKLYYTPNDFKCIIVTPSRWMKNCAQSSLLLKNKTVVHIGNCLNTTSFKPIEKHWARSLLNINIDKKVIIFGAVDAMSNINKGFAYLQRAIKYLYCNNLIDNLEIIIFGSNEPKNKPDFGYKTKYVGHLYDDVTLNILYAAADATIVPSKSENLPNVIMESMAVGTPCVAFNIGGIADMIDHQFNGYLARPYNTEDLANGIEFVLRDRKQWKKLSDNARDKIVKNYDSYVIANKYKALYENILFENTI
ncbi:MAG: glycosyltransferase [Lachnospiraceae bacterium]|nr:glycosyltransferase [Lachnospiraceae bacterium]